MACFIVPAAEAIVTTAIAKTAEKNEKHVAHIELDTNAAVAEEPKKTPITRKLKWLSNMLWGGAVLLLFEHVWHGEVVPFPPFLSAMSNSADTAEMLHEMATAGVAMAVLITAVWGVMVAVTGAIENRTEVTSEEA